jgi:transposase
MDQGDQVRGHQAAVIGGAFRQSIAFHPAKDLHRDHRSGRARNLVERFFNKIKHCRRVATRYDKLAANFLAFVQLASIRLWLRVNESTT